jgi:hypothetical protein
LRGSLSAPLRTPHSAATYQAFVREASLSFELIAKAVIAQRLEAGKDRGAVARVPAIHNASQLWAIARLPSL